MPLLDHFHPPLSERRHWQGFHSRWASSIADALNAEGLGESLFAEPTIDLGSVEVDVATLDEMASTASNGAQSVAAMPHIMAPTWVIPAVFPDTFEVRVISSDGGPKLVAAIELISPANKDRPQSRRTFAIKCASYLAQGIHLIIVDVVTNRQANLHNEIMELLQTAEFRFPPATTLYAAAYRPVRRATREEIDIWPTSFNVGDALPSLPLHVGLDWAVTVDLDATYQETCLKLRVA